MEKTYQYIGQLCKGSYNYPHGIVFSPTFTTDDEILQEFIENSPKFINGAILLTSDVEKDYPEPHVDVKFMQSRYDLFEGEKISTIKVPRLKAAAEAIGVPTASLKGLKKHEIVALIMARTVK